MPGLARSNGPGEQEMRKTLNYEAVWVPGLDRYDVDPDDALEVAFDWLRTAEGTHGGSGILVMNAALMRRNRPLLGSAPWDIVSPRTQRPRGQGPVLAVWPVARTLDLAEHLAFGTALCVVAGNLFDISPWIRRTGATCLVEGFKASPAVHLANDVTDDLDHMASFGGHNNFLGGGDKELSIRVLRDIARRSDAPSREAIVEYLLSTGETEADGAERAGRWYEEIRQGKRHRDYGGRII